MTHTTTQTKKIGIRKEQKQLNKKRPQQINDMYILK